MHESSLVRDLIHKAESVARQQHARKVLSMKIRLGASSHISPAHLRNHFTIAAAGSLAEGARLDVETLTDYADPLAQEVLLASVELEM